MTTIAYCSGVIAYDSRISLDDRIVTDNGNKHVLRRGVHFFFCGATSDMEEFAERYFEPGDCDRISKTSALVWDGGKLYYCGADKDEGYIWRCPVSLKEPRAMGSGMDHAITAMDMGADAKTAVKMAAKRDSGTGGRIRTFHCK